MLRGILIPILGVYTYHVFILWSYIVLVEKQKKRAVPIVPLPAVSKLYEVKMPTKDTTRKRDNNAKTIVTDDDGVHGETNAKQRLKNTETLKAIVDEHEPAMAQEYDTNG